MYITRAKVEERKKSPEEIWRGCWTTPSEAKHKQTGRNNAAVEREAGSNICTPLLS